MHTFPRFARRLPLLSLTSLAALVALGVVAPACTAPSEDPVEDGSESDLHIKPKDGESLGRLMVTTPSGWTLPVNPADDVTVSYRGSAVALNVEQRLKEGAGDVVVRSKFDSPLTSTNVMLTKGKTTNVDLGSIKPTFDLNGTLKRDFGPTPSLKVFFASPGGSEYCAQQGSNGSFWNGAPARAILALPGAYRFSWSLPILADTTKTLAGGENATIALDPSDQRATIVVKKPTARDLPDAPPQQCHVAAQSFIVQRRVDNANGQYGEPPSYDQNNTSQPAGTPIQTGYDNYGTAEQINAWAALPMKDDTTMKVFPFAASEGAMHYELVTSNVAMPLALKPGDTKIIQLERIEIDDVAVTKDTGDTYTVKGTWQIFRLNNTSWVPITVRHDCSTGAAQQVSYPTNTGIDVLPGSYRVIISYTTAEGPKTQDQTVTVP